MAFAKRTSITTLKNSKWMTYAVQRTGVKLPNCFTYATARISEIVGKNQSLDGTKKVAGAQDLWKQHAAEFSTSQTPVAGALAIWQYGTYGHVAVVEAVNSATSLEWSQSNYGGKEFEYIKGNPKNYLGMKLLGYLVHKNLPKATTTSTAKKPDQILTVGSVVVSKAMSIKAGIKKINGVDCVNVPALGGYFPLKYLNEYDASDGKLDQYIANDKAKVVIAQTTVQKVDKVKNLVMIHDIWVDPTPLTEIKDGK